MSSEELEHAKPVMTAVKGEDTLLWVSFTCDRFDMLKSLRIHAEPVTTVEKARVL